VNPMLSFFFLKIDPIVEYENGLCNKSSYLSLHPSEECAFLVY